MLNKIKEWMDEWTMRRNTKNLLKDAAELIREKGWVQGFYEKDGGFCAVGAVHATINLNPNRYGGYGGVGGYRYPSGALHALNAVAKNYKGDYGFVAEYRSIVDYNDTPGRTKEEVLAVFKAARRAV